MSKKLKALVVVSVVWVIFSCFTDVVSFTVGSPSWVKHFFKVGILPVVIVWGWLWIFRGSEQSKADMARDASEDARRCAGGRKAYLAEVKQKFGYLLYVSIPESEAPSTAYVGASHSLVAPVRMTDVSEALGILEFKLIDAVKAGLVEGVVDRQGEWWIGAKNG